MKAILVKAVVAAILVSVHLSSTALADDVNCPPNLGDVTIDGNVLVAAPCRLDGTTVKGNVHLYAGGSLIARNADIDGNIQAENSDFIDVVDSHIGGSVQLDDLVGDLTNVTNSTIDGSIQLKDNRSRIEIAGNTVGADIQAFGNLGGVDVSDNVVDGNLQCKSNNPAPTGGNNRVSGNEEDQCADLSSGGGNATAGNVEQQSGSGGGAVGPFGLLLGTLPLMWFRRRRAAQSTLTGQGYTAPPPK